MKVFMILCCLGGFALEWTKRQTERCDCRVPFATENDTILVNSYLVAHIEPKMIETKMTKKISFLNQRMSKCMREACRN